jgi:hypothetical protein
MKPSHLRTVLLCAATAAIAAIRGLNHEWRGLLKYDYTLAYYNKWIWGRSARRYQEPYISVGHGF